MRHAVKRVGGLASVAAAMLVVWQWTREPTAAALSGSPESSCSPDHDGAPMLELEEHKSWHLAASTPPIALAALNADEVWALLGPTRHLYRLGGAGDAKRVGAAADSGFSSIHAGSGRLLVVKDTLVLAYDPRDDRFTVLVTSRGINGPIVAVAEHDSTVLMVTWRARVGSLRRAVVATTLPAQAQLIDSGKWVGSAPRLHATARGTFIAARVQAPYTVEVLDGEGRRTADAVPRLAMPGVTESGPQRAIVSVSATPLDCEMALQTISDLRTDDRWLVLYRVTDSVREIRTTKITAPIGIVQALERERLLLGYDDSPGRGDVTLYAWKWK